MKNLFRRICAIMLVLCLLTTMPPAAVLAEDGSTPDDFVDELLEIEYSVSGFNGPYDGNPHSISLNVGTSGVTVLYTDPVNGGYSETNPTFTEIGTYTVQFLLKKEGYMSAEGSATVTIAKGQIDYSVEGFDVEYDGQPHSIALTVRTPDVSVSYATSADGPYSSQNPAFTDVGMYTVFYKLSKDNY